MASEWPAWMWRSDGSGVIDGDPWLGAAELLTDTYLHRDAARAWQALRDWLNGTPEQWQQYAEGMYAYGRQLGWEDV